MGPLPWFHQCLCLHLLIRPPSGFLPESCLQNSWSFGWLVASPCPFVFVRGPLPAPAQSPSRAPVGVASTRGIGEGLKEDPFQECLTWRVPLRDLSLGTPPPMGDPLWNVSNVPVGSQPGGPSESCLGTLACRKVLNLGPSRGVRWGACLNLTVLLD